ncbi:MAG: hypothetical protein AAB855_04855 [Patescibacteria group bacterium]
MNIYQRILLTAAITYVIGVATWIVIYWNDTGYQPELWQYLMLPFFLAAGMPILAIIVFVLVFCGVSAFALHKKKHK